MIESKIIGEVAHKYGAPGAFDGTGDINISYDQLEENISRLKHTIEALEQLWKNTKGNTEEIRNSWAGADCDAYIEKLQSMDTRVNKTISALKLLCSTYEKARDLVSESQQSATKAINNI